jgi:methylthioribose-1-phosphate isomerase
VAPPEIRVRNPAFDITPQEFVTAIVTDAGVVYPPYQAGLQRAFAAPRRR